MYSVLFQNNTDSVFWYIVQSVQTKLNYTARSFINVNAIKDLFPFF